MQRIDTPSGKFEAGDPITRRPGTMVTSQFMNDIQEEICNVIELSDIELNGKSQQQLYTAIQKLIAVKFGTASGVIQGTYGSSVLTPVITVDETGKITSITTQQSSVGLPYATDVPSTKVGDAIYVQGLGNMEWVETAYYVGYRTLLCGHWSGGTTRQPRPFQIEAEGDIYDIAAYPALWGYAQENDLVIDAGEWEPGWIRYAQIGSDQFRVPDLRNIFKRMSGTDVDTANARQLGTQQGDAIRKVVGSFDTRVGQQGIQLCESNSGAFYTDSSARQWDVLSITRIGATVGAHRHHFDLSRVVPVSLENRSINTSVTPFIYV